MTPLAGDDLRRRCLAAVSEEGARFAGLARALDSDGGLDRRVPWVAEWTARDLVGHLGTVHRWATAIVTAGHTGRPPAAATEDPPAKGLPAWYAAGLHALLGALQDTPPSAPAWHMSPAAEKVVASWVRRQAHELLVHRMDLEVTAGVPHADVDPQLAEDGIDELLRIVVPRWAHTEPLATAGAAVGVAATDTGRTWSVRVDHGAITVTDEPAGAEEDRKSVV